MDTRAGVVLSGLSGPFGANTPRRLDVTGHWGVPSGAEAITGNLTVVNQTAAGYVSATLASDPDPDDLGPQLPARRHAGQRRHPAAQRQPAGRGSSTRRLPAGRPT